MRTRRPPTSRRASRRPPITVRMMAIVQVSVFEAVNAITGRYPAAAREDHRGAGRLGGRGGRRGDADRAARSSCRPSRRPSTPTTRPLLRPVPDGPAKTEGIAVGEQAATAIVALCADDGVVAPDTIAPHTAAGVYVPTMVPAVPHWGKRQPVGDDQRRPVPSGPAARADQRRPGRGTSTRSRRSAGRTAPSARRSRPPSRSSGRRRPRPSTGRSRARSRPCPAATSPTTRACSRWPRWPWTTR